MGIKSICYKTKGLPSRQWLSPSRQQNLWRDTPPRPTQVYYQSHPLQFSRLCCLEAWRRWKEKRLRSCWHPEIEWDGSSRLIPVADLIRNYCQCSGMHQPSCSGRSFLLLPVVATPWPSIHVHCRYTSRPGNLLSPDHELY